jgi:hypothetical protein
MSASAEFDTSYYLTNNADVVVAISQGHFANALDHFNQFGGKELRAPNASFNPSYYAINNSDVLNAVSSGVFANVFAHYQAFGETENRAPNSNLASFDSAAYLAANADVAAAVTAGSFTSALDHFIQFGQNESRSGSGVTETVNPGSTFSLTTGIDSGASFTGTANGDTFDAGLTTSGGVANQQTLNTLDSLDGGDGTDTLNFTYNTAVTPLSIANIENITITDADAATETLNFVNVTGLTSLTSIASQAGVDVNNLTAIPTIKLQNQAVNVDLDFVNTVVSGSDDTITLEVSGNTDGDVTIEGVETVNLVSSGTANTLDVNDTATTLTTINISGDTAVTLNDTTALEAEVTTVNASNATGNVTLGANATPLAAAVHTLTGGSGNDTFVLGGTYIGGATGSTRDTIDGGDGTDELNITSARLVAGTATQANLTSIERIELSDALNGTVNLTNFGSISELQLTLGGAASAGSVTAATGTTIDIDADMGDQQYQFIVTGIATDDTMTLDLATNIDFLGTTGNIDTFTGIETLTIAGASSGTHIFADGIALGATAASEKIVITGGAAVTFSAQSTTDELDASAATGIITTTGGFAGAVNVKGGNKADVLNGSGSSDIITGNDGADDINGGLGADTIILTETTAASDEVIIDGGITADTVVGFTTGATSGDQIDIDISNLNTANLLTNGETDTIAFFGTAGAAITDATAGATNAIATISNDSAVHATVANATLILLDGGSTTFANVGTAVDAFEASGSFTITHQSNVADDDTFLFAYENSSTGSVHIAAASFEAADNNAGGAAAIADSALKGTDLVILSGVTDVTTVAADNIDFV